MNTPNLEHIIQDPAIMVGKPVVRGTRIPVELVLTGLAADLDELFAAYPRPGRSEKAGVRGLNALRHTVRRKAHLRCRKPQLAVC
jgi:hypothetical protein